MATKQQTADARESLRSTFPAGSTVHTLLRHVTRSGMSRSISVLVADTDGIHDVSWQVARALEWRFDANHNGVKVDGAGMDMGFHLVYTLSQVLHGDGYALKHRWI